MYYFPKWNQHSLHPIILFKGLYNAHYFLLKPLFIVGTCLCRLTGILADESWI